MSQKLCTAVLTDVLEIYQALSILQKLYLCKSVLFQIPIFWEKNMRADEIIKEKDAPPDWL